MAWSWSHTNEAYSAAIENMSKLGDRELSIIWAEINGSERDENFNYDLIEPEYFDKLHEYYQEDQHVRIGEIEVFMRDFRTCDNGGFNAWCCPFGCGCHTVPFD